MIGSTNSVWKINNRHGQLVNYTMLYDFGDECTNITGGWTSITGTTSAKNNNTFEKRSDCLYHSNGKTTGSTTSWQGLFITNNTVPLSGYTKVIGVAVSNVGTEYYAFGLVTQVRKSKTCGDGYVSTDLVGGFTSVKEFKINTINSDTNDYVSSSCRSSNYSLYALGLLKKDNWQELCTIAGLTPSDYADEITLCANGTAITTILSNKKAVEFMIYNCTGSFMGEFVASSTCLTLLNNSQFKTLIMANEHWAKFLNMVA